jgi:hypothetical protein
LRGGESKGILSQLLLGGDAATGSLFALLLPCPTLCFSSRYDPEDAEVNEETGRHGPPKIGGEPSKSRQEKGGTKQYCENPKMNLQLAFHSKLPPLYSSRYTPVGLSSKTVQQSNPNRLQYLPVSELLNNYLAAKPRCHLKPDIRSSA